VGCTEQGLSLCGRVISYRAAIKKRMLRPQVEILLCLDSTLTRSHHNDSAATQTVSVDAVRRGYGLWHLGPGLKAGEDGEIHR